MDKWFEKSVNRWLGSGYYDNLFLNKDSPYCTRAAGNDIDDAVINTIMDQASKLTLDAGQVAGFIFNYYQRYGLNGQVFGSVQRIIRSLPVAHAKQGWALKNERSLVAKSVPILERNPDCLKAIFTQIKLLTHDVDKFAYLADAKSSTRSLGGKDSEYVQDKLAALGYVGVTCASKFDKHDKAFIINNRTAILGKLGIDGLIKSPDVAAKNKDTLYIVEDKVEVEQGGAQTLSRRDGRSIFDYRNRSAYKTRMVFCFDGDYNLLEAPQSLITTDQKIMSILDVVDYIESGE